jgi:hypothetical protein
MAVTWLRRPANYGDAHAMHPLLTASSAYEIGQTAQEVSFVLYPVYFRGEAYLSAKQSAPRLPSFRKSSTRAGLRAERGESSMWVTNSLAQARP